MTWGHLTRGFHLSAWLLGLVGFPALLVAGQWLRTSLMVDQAAAERARFPGSPTVRAACHTGHS